MKIFKKFFKDFLEDFSKIFQEYSRNISPKAVTKVVKKQANVACVILFTPFYITFEGPNVNEIISYSGQLYNKILDLIMCKKVYLFSNYLKKKKAFGVKNRKLSYDCFWFLLT
jgi:hypothetical protein